jgi:drug/metabolite transporter (DMT)-like permease
VTTIPIFTALLGFLVLKERLHPVRSRGSPWPRWGSWCGLARQVGACGPATRGTVGDLLVLGSAVNWAVFTVLSRSRIGSTPPRG